MSSTVNHVYNVFSNQIYLSANSKASVNEVKNIGGKRILFSKTAMTIEYKNQIELVAIVKKLINLDFCFMSGGPGWTPSDIVEKLKDDGELDLKFKDVLGSTISTEPVITIK